MNKSIKFLSFTIIISSVLISLSIIVSNQIKYNKYSFIQVENSSPIVCDNITGKYYYGYQDINNSSTYYFYQVDPIHNECIRNEITIIKK